MKKSKGWDPQKVANWIKRANEAIEVEKKKREKEHRLQVIRSLCGSYEKGTCDGKCVECLDRFLTKNSAIDASPENP